MRVQQQFVANSYCQEKMAEVWYGRFRFIESSNMIVYFLFSITCMILYPFIAVAYLVWPCSPRVGYLRRVIFLLIFFLLTCFAYLLPRQRLRQPGSTAVLGNQYGDQGKVTLKQSACKLLVSCHVITYPIYYNAI
jgi:prepilin signal peptidase PulO-like enzyme (type II secretory pathway)